ncbi:hypothetical protein Cri9333_0591 [Crinalium epipsammum PCC 9333]|uniref:VWFA domain-containing protein n=1 Tax=Crinalium epipsammum PCC 9333 TaxID=1173022 RepID=K9VVN5_9CYAN|nr:hypothetical protein [Crinalium epipsammum]AFZ11537.1 hypothetical protein Cri9333_0591 [Crinalium epipsammum PCC 9333]
MKHNQIALLLLLLLPACQVSPDSTSVIKSPTSNPKPIIAGVPSELQPDTNKLQVNTRPLKIVVEIDKSLSTNQTKVQQPKWQDFQPLLQKLRQIGGELAIGTICNNSNQSFIRLRLEKPLTLPQKPIEPSNNINPLKLPELQAEYEKKLTAYQQQLQADQQQQQQWEQNNTTKIKQFQTKLQLLLNKSVACTRTDIWNAVNRADLFLAENDASWGQSTNRIAVLISDGIDDVKAKFLPMKSKAKVILVNGSANIGSLTSLNPELFESTPAAFRYIIATNGGK